MNRIDPLGLADLEETSSTDVRISTSKEVEQGLTNVRDRVDCLLNTAAATLFAISFGEASGETLVSIASDFAECDAEVTREPDTCSLCFAAGTLIHTDHGEIPIEKLEVGDEVISRNRETGKLESKPITALTPLHKDTLLDIRIEGEATPFHPSTGHPFFIKRGNAPAGSWVEAGRMQVGDLVQTIQGRWS